MKMYAKHFLILAFLTASIQAAQYWPTGSDGKRYLIDTDQAYNWFQAQHKCEQQNMQLIEIQSAQKNNILLAILRSLFASPPNLWLGANDEYNTSKDYKRPFYWSTSGSRMSFSYWSKNNPDNYNGAEHCVQIWNAESAFTWNDNQCTVKIGYICEENYVSVEKCQKLQAKQQEVSGIMTNIETKNLQHQQQQSEALSMGFQSLEELDGNCDETLLQAHAKLEADVQELLTQNRNVAMAAIEKRKISRQSQKVQTTTTVDKSNKEFSALLESSHKNIDSVLKC